MVVERRYDRAYLSAPAGGELARRQALYRRGRQMHLGPDPGQERGQTADQPAQVLVPQPGYDQHHRRYRDVPLKETAAGLYCLARLGLFAGLSVPYSGPGDATAP